MVTWGGMTWEQIGLSQNDMDFLNQRKLNKYEICGIFGVPPQIVGANEDPTYSNYAVALLAFWESKIIPLLNWVETMVNTRFSDQYYDGVIVKPDLTSVPALRESVAQKVKMAATLSAMGWPINAINERLGLGFDAVPWGDTAYYPGTMVPAELVGEVPSQVGQPSDSPGTSTDDSDEVEPEDDPGLDVEGESGLWSRKHN
jgi:hypothetical protein